MSDVFRMPSLGADMEAGTLIEWLKQPGERFVKGEAVAVVETQKGAIEVEVFHDGVMGSPLVELGHTVPVGTPLAEIETLGAEGGRELPQAAPEQPIPPAPIPESRPTARTPVAAERPRTSPAARRLAGQLGLTLGGLDGHGPDGAIRLADVQRAAAAPTPQPAVDAPKVHRGLDLAAMREAIAAAMAHSKREIPHYYLSHTVDLTPAADWLARRNAGVPPERRVLMGALFVKAVALALRSFPELNGLDRNGRFEPSAAIHVGAATAIRGGGLVAPAIHDADKLDLDTLMERLRDLVARVRAGQLRSSELADPTVTVSSLGERGVDRLYGIVYPPQVAIVGFGTPSQRPWVLEGQVVPRTLVDVTLSADHRHSDGHRGALFLAQLGERLQEPENL